MIWHTDEFRFHSNKPKRKLSVFVRICLDGLSFSMFFMGMGRGWKISLSLVSTDETFPNFWGAFRLHQAVSWEIVQIFSDMVVINGMMFKFCHHEMGNGHNMGGEYFSWLSGMRDGNNSEIQIPERLPEKAEGWMQSLSIMTMAESFCHTASETVSGYKERAESFRAERLSVMWIPETGRRKTAFVNA